MSAKIIQFVPRPRPERPSLMEGEELKAMEFLAPALIAGPSLISEWGQRIAITHSTDLP